MNYGEVIGDFFTDIVGGIGDNFQAGAADAQAKANINNAQAAYIMSKANSERQTAQAYTKAITVLAGGLIAALIIYVAAKFLIPKLK